jgi:paraquat-inducible protein A
MNHQIIVCPTCGLAQQLGPLPAGTVAKCFRCNSGIAKANHNALTRTAALSVAGLLLYVPANIYPILRMDYYGTYRENTVWSGCVQLFEDGQWPVAIIVFLASIVVPLLKLLGLFFLVVTTRSGSLRFRHFRTAIHGSVKAIGPWAMLDVFLLAILVSLVKLGRIATVIPGPGLLAFTSVVVLTILASESFDSKQIWEDPQPT